MEDLVESQKYLLQIFRHIENDLYEKEFRIDFISTEYLDNDFIPSQLSFLSFIQLYHQNTFPGSKLINHWLFN